MKETMIGNTITTLPDCNSDQLTTIQRIEMMISFYLTIAVSL